MHKNPVAVKKASKQRYIACEKNQENKNCCVRNQISCLKMSRQLLPALVHSSSYLGPKRPSAADCGEFSLSAIDGTQSRFPGKEEALARVRYSWQTICVIQTKWKCRPFSFHCCFSHCLIHISAVAIVLDWMVHRCTRCPPKEAFG